MKVKPGPITKAARILRKAGLTCDEATEAAYLIREISQEPGGAKLLKELIREQVKPNERQNSNSDERSCLCN